MHDPLKTSWGNAVRLEMAVAKIIQQQEENGWKLDIPLTKQHIDTLTARIAKLDLEIKSGVPPRILQGSTIVGPYKKDGLLSVRASKYAQGTPVGGPFSVVMFEELNLASHNQIKEFLLSRGWVPTEWNYNDDGDKTSPKLTEDSYASLKDDVGKKIADRMVCAHRRSQLQGFLENVREDGRIEAQANTVGTNTGRMRHRVIVNLPKAKDYVFFGKQMREVFIAEEGSVLVDYDAVALELRMLGHYLKNQKLIDAILGGDWHSKVWKQIEDFVSNRDISKTIFYALTYGAGDEKLGRSADIIPDGMKYAQVGMIIRARIMAGIPELKWLIDTAKERARSRGYVLGLDGRRLYTRGESSALNTLLQGAGAIVMKQAMVVLDQWIIEEQLPAKKVGDMHDEGILEVPVDAAQRVKELCEKCVPEAGRILKLNCPLAADARIGANWSLVH